MREITFSYTQLSIIPHLVYISHPLACIKTVMNENEATHMLSLVCRRPHHHCRRPRLLARQLLSECGDTDP